MCGSLHTINNTGPEVLADSAHPDPQLVHASESIRQQSPGLDLVASLKLVIPGYQVAVAGSQLFHTMFQTIQLVLVDLRIAVLRSHDILIQSDGPAFP
jgi:hypothetical protein